MSENVEDYQRLLAEGPWKIIAIQIQMRPDGLAVDISLVTECKKDVQIAFAGVRNLRFIQTTQNWHLSLEVADIGDRQWEDLNFSVEGDQGDFAFYCRDIAIER